MDSYLGLDLSTQSASGLLLAADGAVLWEHSVNFHKDLPGYGTEHGVIRRPGGEVVSPPLMWVEALDLLLGALARSGADLSSIRAVSGSGQQHGSVYVTDGFPAALSGADPQKPLAPQLKSCLARELSPVWMDTSTEEECREITEAAGGIDLVKTTGSPAVLRFTGPQVRRFWKRDPEGYRRTARIHLVSSFACTLLCGKEAPIDHADGSGMNLLDLGKRSWHPKLLEATAPELGRRLLPAAACTDVVGTVSAYWAARHDLPASARVVAFSGDNPCTLAGLGLPGSGSAAISLGTSDTHFGVTEELRVSGAGEGHVFASPLGGYMSLICHMNGSLAREKVRERFTLSWPDFEKALASTPPGNRGRIMLPWFVEEITPRSRRAQVYRFGFKEDDAAASCRAVFEGQMMAMRLHSRHLGKPSLIHATGGASRSDGLLRVMSDVFGARVRRLQTQAGASFGSALRAMQAATGRGWQELSGTCVRFDRKDFEPDPVAHSRYEDLLAVFEAAEAFVLAGGKDPEGLRVSFIRRWS